MPYDDKDMYYDNTWEQYVLNADFPKNKIAMPQNLIVELGKSDYLKKLCYEASDDIYNYIYRHGKQETQPTKKYVIENLDEERKLIKKAMLYQIRYSLRSGGNMIKDMAGIDFRKGKVIPLKEQRGERGIAKSAIDVLSQSNYLLKSTHINEYWVGLDE